MPQCVFATQPNYTTGQTKPALSTKFRLVGVCRGVNVRCFGARMTECRKLFEVGSTPGKCSPLQLPLNKEVHVSRLTCGNLAAEENGTTQHTVLPLVACMIP